jgi:hypothetical protein
VFLSRSNYDRSLEHYLFTILKSTCGKSAEECWRIFLSIPIIHIYGQLGLYNPVGSGLAYGSPLELPIAREAAKNIWIMHESKNQGLIQQGKDAVREAEVICFLGFGYHRENLAPLGIKSDTPGKHILGTAYGLTEDERRRLDLGEYVDDARDCTIFESDDCK